jgi:diguanylate cyclase (GGDEF)-like protein/PAS domain S-box-containing protein
MLEPLKTPPIEQDTLTLALAREFFHRTSTAAPIALLSIIAVLVPNWQSADRNLLLLWSVLLCTPLCISAVHGRWALKALECGARADILVNRECILAAICGAAWGLMPLMADTGALDALFYYRVIVFCITIVFVLPVLGYFLRVWLTYTGLMWVVMLGVLVYLPYTAPIRATLILSLLIYAFMALCVAVMDNRRTIAALRDNLAVKLLSQDLAMREQALQQRVKEQTAELTRTVESLREQEVLLSNSQQMARVGYFVFNTQTRQFRTSPVLDQILGLTDAAPRTFASWLKHIHPEHQERISRATAQVPASPDAMELTYPIVRSTDGATRWVRSNSQLERNTDGSIKSWFGNLQDITEHKEAQDKIHALAFYDPLTQLANRRLLQDRLEQALLTSRRSLSHGALLMLDLDNFKSINDTRGHALGDLLLVEVARRIGACLREVDSVARIGGDEFVVTLENLGQDREQAATLAAHLAEKLRLALQLPYALEAQTFHSSTSIGITLFQKQDTDFQNLLRQADLALYQAKDSGRNTIRMFEHSMQEAVDRKAEREVGLRNAIANHELTLYYQPQVDQAGNVTGAEALLRWMTADGTMISPDDFIALAEESELILDIGAWVLEAGCAQLKVWQSHPDTRHLQLAINVSARQFRDSEFEAQLAQVIVRSGIDATGLKLELTESMVLQNVAMVVQRMHALRRCGLKFALDDFGTGYSSLSYLRQLPLDQLKIDQSFVRDLANGSQGPAILKAIIDMGKSLQLEVIAEGVETESQKHFLADSGCGLFQGYLFGRPLPIAQFPLQH